MCKNSSFYSPRELFEHTYTSISGRGRSLDADYDDLYQAFSFDKTGKASSASAVASRRSGYDDDLGPVEDNHQVADDVLEYYLRKKQRYQQEKRWEVEEDRRRKTKEGK